MATDYSLVGPLARLELEKQRQRYLEHPDFARLKAAEEKEEEERERLRALTRACVDRRLFVSTLAFWVGVAAFYWLRARW